MAVELSDSNFKQEILESQIPALVDFWAPWCGPCRMVAPVLDEIAGQYKGKLKIGKLNVDEAPGTSSKYNITSIPTIMLFKDGKITEKMVGAGSKSDIEKLVKPHIK
jgi:thioredoxin 1